jgi:hypothetical protein
MPHYCRICGRNRRNEKFSGRGHRNHICKDCQRLPREQLDRIERMDELYGFLDQSNISPKNIARLEALARHANSEIKDLALLILEVARVKPHKRRRWRFLEQNHPDLFQRLKALSPRAWAPVASRPQGVCQGTEEVRRDALPTVGKPSRLAPGRRPKGMT